MWNQERNILTVTVIKTTVFAIAERDGKRIFTKVVANAKSETLLPVIYQNIKPGHYCYVR